MSLLASLEERTNPIVLQEVRRGLRTRVFSVAFVLLLSACAVIALIAYGTYEPGSSGSGKGTFIAVYACLSVVAYFMLPYAAYRSLAREREDRTWSLLVLTGLSPRRILAGKVGSFVLQAGLYASAIAPFLLFAYLLQGVSLMAIAALLGASLAWHLFLTTAAVAAATLGESRLARGALHFLVLGALLFGAGTGFGFGTALVSMSSASELEAMLVVAGVGSWFMLAYGLILFAVAVSRLTFESDNHALWPRLALLVHFLGTALLATYVQAAHGVDELGVILGLLGTIHAFLAGLFTATGRPGLSKRLQARPRRRLLRLLEPGAACGLRFSVLLVLLFAAAGGGLVILEGRHPEHLGVLAAMAALAVLYLALPVVLGRGPLRRWLASPALLQVFAVLLAVAALGLPPLAALVAGLDVDHEGFNWLNPIVVAPRLADDADPERVGLLGLLAAALLWVAHWAAAARDREASGG